MTYKYSIRTILTAISFLIVGGLAACGKSNTEPSAPSVASNTSTTPLSPLDTLDQDMRCGGILTYMTLFGTNGMSDVATATYNKLASYKEADMAAAGLSAAEFERRAHEPNIEFESNFAKTASGETDFTNPVPGAQENIIRQYADCVTWVNARPNAG